MKRIAVLTSGGDAPGMNAAVRAVVRAGIDQGLTVFGVMRGYEGLLNDEIKELSRRDVGSIVNRGGTMLKTARCLEFKEPEKQQQAIEVLKKHQIDALVVVGGDGSMAGAMALAGLGMPTITLPGTIDNDMCGTQYTIGFDTALNTVVDAVSKIRDTTTAHDRVAIVEVMGRHAGHIAVGCGLACGAELALIPENPLPLDDVCEHLKKSHAAGKTNSIIVVAEGTYHGFDVCAHIKKCLGLTPSVTVLGYLQRGGAPSAKDATMAALMGKKAIDSLMSGTVNALIGVIDADIVATPYEQAKNMRFPVSEQEYELIKTLGR